MAAWTGSWHPFGSAMPLIKLLAIAGLLLTLLATGCGTLSGPGSASFASVTIPNHSPEEIAAVTAQVFAADGYAGGVSGPGQMVFEKETSRGTTMMREGVFAAQGGAQTINRVRAEIVRLSDREYRLQCQAYMVTGGSDPFFQDETALAHVRSLPYQSLLNKVKEQLQ
jgi:hypothetical protein